VNTVTDVGDVWKLVRDRCGHCGTLLIDVELLHVPRLARVNHYCKRPQCRRRTSYYFVPDIKTGTWRVAR